MQGGQVRDPGHGVRRCWRWAQSPWLQSFLSTASLWEEDSRVPGAERELKRVEGRGGGLCPIAKPQDSGDSGTVCRSLGILQA